MTHKKLTAVVFSSSSAINYITVESHEKAYIANRAIKIKDLNYSNI